MMISGTLTPWQERHDSLEQEKYAALYIKGSTKSIGLEN